MQKENNAHGVQTDGHTATRLAQLLTVQIHRQRRNDVLPYEHSDNNAIGERRTNAALNTHRINLPVPHDGKLA